MLATSLASSAEVVRTDRSLGSHGRLRGSEAFTKRARLDVLGGANAAISGDMSRLPTTAWTNVVLTRFG